MKKINRIIYGSIILLIVLLCCLLIFSFSWLTGHFQNITCRLVTFDSQAAKTLNCETGNQNSVDNGNQDFDFQIAETDIDTVNNADFDPARIYQQTSGSVVGIGISGNTSDTDQLIGSGFVVSSQGLIATNQHVVAFAEVDYFVKFEGSDELVPVVEIFRDRVNDLAILRVEKENLQPLILGDPESVAPGQNVVAIGNPLGELSSTITSGIVSAINREVEVGDGSFLRSNLTQFDDAIQTDAAINPGNSGGPLLNSLGQVIGINFATVAGFDNLSFAIPVTYLETRLNEIKEFGRFRIPYLGIGYRMRLVAVGNEVFVGAQVTSVDRESDAAGNLQRGDIIVTFSGQDLEGENLANLIQRSEIGEEVEIGIIGEDGERSIVKVEITESE